MTNGIRLAEPRYVAELVRNGLHGVSLSLNALDGKILEATDGRDWLDAKLQAVSNLKRHFRRFAVCFSLVRGVNETEFDKVFQFAVRQYPFARSFHAECLPGIGRSMNTDRMFLSQMLDMLADSTGVTRAYLLGLTAQDNATVGSYGFAADYRDLGGATIRLDVHSDDEADQNDAFATARFPRARPCGSGAGLGGFGRDVECHDNHGGFEGKPGYAALGVSDPLSRRAT